MSDHDTVDALEPDEAQQLARRLREAREFTNLPQQFVSEQTGIPRSAISDIERGTRRVESLELKRLAELYRMPVGYLLGDVAPTDDDLTGMPAPDPTVEALTRTASEMGEKERGEVLRFALFLRNFERRGGPEK
ncbi:MAG TPA: helix-turn-helix transcriptional regulator [Gaiellaceae bacterium]|nr:helix-turn-helix transcriptional regulator [Gaiellaceae bacterium]